MAAKKSKTTVWNFLDSLRGDKVVWVIYMMLILISIVCIFSSTSRLVGANQTRLDIVKGQLTIIVLGVAVVVFCYNIKNFGVYRKWSRWGFLFSITLLVLLDIGGIGPFKAQEINGAVRSLSVFGKQVHVFEFVKVAMVMYLSWAVDAFNKDGKRGAPKELWLAEKLGSIDKLSFMRKPLAKKITYIYGPFVLTTIAIMPGSNSSAMFIGAIMFLTIVIGGGNIKDAIHVCLLGVGALALCFMLYSVSGGRMFQRIGTAIARTEKVDWEKQMKEARMGSTEYYKAKDKLTQPYSAKIAIHQGGLIGKGPGQSTQRYAVPDMPEDFMFSFICEEYGLLGGIFVMALFLSLLARGVHIAPKCGDELFPKAALAGLILLTTGQAFMHIFVNADFGLLTGQTLPLISHGNTAFLCFSLAFGIILSISRLAQDKLEREIKMAEALAEAEKEKAARSEEDDRKAGEGIRKYEEYES